MANLDYIFVLKALSEIPFGVGKKLLIEFMQGKLENESIIKNNLHRLDSFGKLAYTKEELNPLIDNLILNNMIQLNSIKGNKFWKVLGLTKKGLDEIENPSLFKKKLSFGFKETITEITDEDRNTFNSIPLLEKYNDEQKKSIICKNSRILCIAGAGSGKTTVLTKRIEFLVNYCSVDPKKILAITFTKKARQEMLSRIDNGLVSVETFNSFCEKILRENNDKVYDKPVRVINYRDKIILIRNALQILNVSMGRAIDIYFSGAQKRGKTKEKLSNIFLNDIFFLRDYFKFKNLPIDFNAFKVDEKYEQSFRMVLAICNYVEAYMKKFGYRDFADQLIDTLILFEKHKELIPEFDHILIDEYQDINSTQIKLIDTLGHKNLFCVGDPRQSIYGWRGSDVRYIINFEEKYPGCDIITLKDNYRSKEHIVNLINSSIKNMGLADLRSNIKGEKDVHLLKFSSQDSEYDFVIKEILSSNLPRKEIFVLARTNKILNDISQLLKQKRIAHIVRSDEMKKSVVAEDGEMTLATIHSIKGMEAEMVFVVGCTPLNFPCKGSEHPVIDIVKIEEYDKEEEEKRLFYVAMSRAKSTLYLTYTRSHTYFLTEEMKNLIGDVESSDKSLDIKINSTPKNDILIRLKDWRSKVSKQNYLPAYCVLNDASLIEISTNLPSSLSELESIKGFGPIKIKKYGEEILDIVSGK